MSKKRLSRRQLLKHGSAAAAASGLAACGPPQPETEQAVVPGGVWEKPPDQRGQGNKRNLILLNVDTFRADNLQCYGGNNLVRCPRLDKFSRDCVIFDDAYPEGMPTIPIRRTLCTGRRIMPYYHYLQHEPVQLPGWHELYHEDVTLAETLHEAGYKTGLIADIPHLQRPGKNFHRGYRYYEWVRGHEMDYYTVAPREQPDFSNLYPPEYLNDPKLNPEGFKGFLNQFVANRKRYTQECEALVELTANNVIRWLKNYHQEGPFFLHMEAFDPHEPWDPPKRFLDHYMPNASPHEWWEPPYADIQVPEEGVARLRANYAAESECVDWWSGEILKTIGELGLFENSVVVFWSDHGALLGEQGQFLKGPERQRVQVTHNPLLVRLPNKERAGEHVKGFVQTFDYMPTFLSLLGLQSPSRVTGTDVWPLVTGETKSTREWIVHGYGWIGAVRTPEWNFSTVMNQDAYGRPFDPQLYNIEDDPQELINVAEKHPDVVADLSAKLTDYLEEGRSITTGSFHAKPVG